VYRRPLLGLDAEAITAELTALGQPGYRGKQIAQWLYKKRIADFAKMTDLPEALRGELASKFALRTATIAAKQFDHETTTKIALRFPDGSVIETVLMLEAERSDDGYARSQGEQREEADYSGRRDEGRGGRDRDGRGGYGDRGGYSDRGGPPQRGRDFSNPRGNDWDSRGGRGGPDRGYSDRDRGYGDRGDSRDRGYGDPRERRDSRDSRAPRPAAKFVIPEGPAFSDSNVAGLRRTICLSTQAGCAMGCKFCASGQLGLKRNLTAAEILEQFYAVSDLLPADQPLTNIVYMGMGEPLHNWDALMRSLKVITSEWGFAMSPRRITVSTVGLPKRMRELADSGIAVNLAVSLHAPNDRMRGELIPTNDVYGGLAQIVEAARYFFDKTGRQVTFEYTLVRGNNDHPDHAKELSNLVRRLLPGANINLIPMNPVEGSDLSPPETSSVEAFARVLDMAGLSVHTRKKKGRSIAAACGQLRLRVEQGASARA
jgi:adenine C2-methylase RlmN of 23S rRNA A2503 and tRNA A37